MNSELTTLATIFLASHRATFNFIEVSEDGNIPNEFSLNIPIFGDSVDKNEFIPAIFETVETEFNWEFITDGVIFTPTVKDGYGVDQFDFIVSKDRMYLVEDFDEEKNLLTEELVTNALFFYMKAHKIEDFVFVQADTTALHVWRLVKKMPWTSLGEQGDEAEFDDVDVTHVKVDWQQAINKSKQDTWDRIYRFLTTSKPASEVKDVWANLMFAPKLHYESVLAQDILRADLTANLHSIRTSAMKSLADFGASSSTKSVLMAAGDLVS
ncbi:hypothetical protein LRY64_00135 [Candidatus Woesebacteria bacterium]|nr:hypothetical protein [Candidatus Woesebacteria bacterium]